MPNNPLKSFVELVKRLGKIAAGVDSLLAGGGSWAVLAVSDINKDGIVNVADIIAGSVLNFL